MTTFADQVYQLGGVPVGFNKDWANIYTTRRNGRTWFVDANYGADGNNGKSWENALLTMDAAFDRLASGDLIYFTGKIQEQLVTPVQVFDVSVIGIGNRPRHADSTPSGGQYATAQWGAPSTGTAAQATVRVLQQGWRFQNILFAAIDADAAMIELVRNAASGNDERDASHATIIGNRFAGAGKGIRFGNTSFTENVFNALILGNKFNACTFGIHAPSGSQPNSIDVNGNWFQGSTNAITAQFQASVIRHNVVQGFTAASNSGGIDVRGGGGNNQITFNTLGGTYSKAGGYNCEAADEWFGNAASTGFVVADPA